MYIIARCKAHPLVLWYLGAPESSAPWSPCLFWFCSETHTYASLFSGPLFCMSFFTLPWTPRCMCLRLSLLQFCSPPFFIIVWQNLWTIIIIKFKQIWWLWFLSLILIKYMSWRCEIFWYNQKSNAIYVRFLPSFWLKHESNRNE
jgi:hypothetical protein